MTRSEIDALLARHRAAFDSRDPSRIAETHAPGASFTSPAAGTVTGRDRIEEVYVYWLAAFPDMTFTWDTPVVEGRRVALFWHFRGTLAGKFFGEARPGTRIEFPGAAVYEVGPDGIESATHVFDFTGALVNAGALKVKPG